MDSCQVLIVGGGPAGSSCAKRLHEAGLDTIILDKSAFPRDKVCGGWITPAVIRELEIDLTEYASGRVLQLITRFRTSRMGDTEVETDYGRPVSYGIRRVEFDDYLLRRCGTRLILGTPLTSMERSGDSWIVNGAIRARLLIGAGGHFCPVARLLGTKARDETAVAAQEIEFEMDPEQAKSCSIRGEAPELYFCSDMKGYGWCFRKENFLNIGLGRLDAHSLPGHVSDFLRWLKESGKVAFALPAAMRGHAYLIFRETKRPVVSDGVLLIGDAAGLAYSQSGEGIRPAIESGLLAADTILAAEGEYTRSRLERYREMLNSRFGESRSDWSTLIGRKLPPRFMQSIAGSLLRTHWFSRRIVLDRWFLHTHEPALDA
ncbi:NAD(P)/FAD-dependent oxidoreductase [Alloacidobacterium dinghuense]|uniref:NAD(P)/FAD-dependent oxidoreductase n=1 Tax=Alloacidobacterium dinghuense TaxID=2763107 RepID=A0A7G8BCM0_9BACT|nr:NAD(P)/FAD-dependent oxidoreductase [Alloacidobacterium dinghuense]QNI30290.1 NAD(P)/FAD-dependent oxidoreductase [Alloacidobacterium dinghuense]